MFRCDRSPARAARFTLTLLTLLIAPAARAQTAPLQVDEFLAGPARDWDGSGAYSSRDDEWVEVRNTTTAPLDLSSFLLTDADSIPRYAFSGTLGPGERLVVFGSTSYNWERATSHPAFGLSLGNTSDAVMLWQVTGADTALVDSVSYRSHEAAADRSVGRSQDTGAWVLFDGLNPYTGTTPPTGTGCAPTPGQANTCGATETRKITWGRFKTLYR